MIHPAGGRRIDRQSGRTPAGRLPHAERRRRVSCSALLGRALPARGLELSIPPSRPMKEKEDCGGDVECCQGAAHDARRYIGNSKQVESARNTEKNKGAKDDASPVATAEDEDCYEER